MQKILIVLATVLRSLLATQTVAHICQNVIENIRLCALIVQILFELRTLDEIKKTIEKISNPDLRAELKYDFGNASQQL